jgi:hypothetical protein
MEERVVKRKRGEGSRKNTFTRKRKTNEVPSSIGFRAIGEEDRGLISKIVEYCTIKNISISNFVRTACAKEVS